MTLVCSTDNSRKCFFSTRISQHGGRCATLTLSLAALTCTQFFMPVEDFRSVVYMGCDFILFACTNTSNQNVSVTSRGDEYQLSSTPLVSFCPGLLYSMLIEQSYFYLIKICHWRVLISKGDIRFDKSSHLVGKKSPSFSVLENAHISLHPCGTV